MTKKKLYPEIDAIHSWTNGDASFHIVRHGSFGHFCGYCILPSRPVKEPGYNGILTYAPVHGGITFARQREDGSMAYGFDCAHHGDDENPNCTDETWLRQECEGMATAVVGAAPFEDRYLLAEGDNTARAEVIDEYLASLGKGLKDADNFGVHIAMLSGRL